MGGRQGGAKELCPGREPQTDGAGDDMSRRLPRARGSGPRSSMSGTKTNDASAYRAKTRVNGPTKASAYLLATYVPPQQAAAIKSEQLPKRRVCLMGDEVRCRS